MSCLTVSHSVGATTARRGRRGRSYILRRTREGRAVVSAAAPFLVEGGRLRPALAKGLELRAPRVSYGRGALEVLGGERASV